MLCTSLEKRNGKPVLLRVGLGWAERKPLLWNVLFSDVHSASLVFSITHYYGFYLLNVFWGSHSESQLSLLGDEDTDLLSSLY